MQAKSQSPYDGSSLCTNEFETNFLVGIHSTNIKICF